MMSNSRWATLVSKASSPGRLSHPPGATDVVEDRPPPDRAGQPKPSSSLLQGRKLGLNGLPAIITGADPDIQGGASGCCHSGSVARISSSSMIVGGFPR